MERGYEPIHPASPWRDMLRKFWAPIALVGFVLWKFKAAFAAIFKLKLFTVVGSAFVSVAAYALIWGWQFGLGFVLLLFVHELGHVAVAKYQGLPVSAPVFIPFMGALILMKEMPQNAWREAQIALGGPILGALGAAACWGLGEGWTRISWSRSPMSASSSTSSTSSPCCRSTGDARSALSTPSSGCSARPCSSLRRCCG